MTDQTIPVPLDLLKRLRSDYPSNAARTDGSPIAALAALIPTPLKVGDTLTVEQVRDLPNASVMRDDDGDVLVKIQDTVRRVTMDACEFDQADWTDAQLSGLLRVYTVTLVSLPESETSE